MPASKQEVFAALAELFGDAASTRDAGWGEGRKDISPGTSVGPYVHGFGGLFNLPGVEKPVISTRIDPQGIFAELPAFDSVYTHSEYLYLTGFGGATGDVKQTACADAPVAGAIRTCIQTARFGSYAYATSPVALNRLGRLRNRAEPTDLRLLNDPFVRALGRLGTPSTTLEGGDTPFFDGTSAGEMSTRMLAVGQEFSDKLIRQIYVGNQSNSVGVDGAYAEFAGFDTLIGTTKVDARTGTPCAELRSDIKDFNYGSVTDSGGGTLIDVISYLVWTRKSIASRTNMGTVRWVFTMRDGLFHELCKVWPCAYMAYRCQAQDNSQVQAVLSLDAQSKMRDDMYNGRYLLVDGERYPVIIDDGIEEDNHADNAAIGLTCFASDIYFIPLTVKGGVPVTYLEYFDFGKNGMPGVRRARYTDAFWTDSGAFLWIKKPINNGCAQLQAEIDLRLVMLTPHLAGRVTNVQYCPRQHTPDAVRGDMYFDASGVENRTESGLYSDWSPSSPQAN